MSESQWAGKNVPQMWASAQAADTQTAWQQVNAWRRTHDLLLHHAGRLQACADELAYAWPPGRSPAAQAFIAYITELRTAILQASTDAATNYTAIAGVLTSLSTAKADMAQLKQAWDSYQNSPTAEKAIRSAGGGSGSPDALNAKARARMAQNDQEVLEASRRLVELTPTRERQTGTPGPWTSGSQDGVGSGGAPATYVGGNQASAWMTAPAISSVDASDGQIGLAGSSAATRLPGSIDPSTPGASPGFSPRPETPMPNPSLGGVGRVPSVRSPLVGDSIGLPRPGGFYGGQSGTANGGSSVAPLSIGSNRGQGKVNPVGGVIDAGRPMSSGSGVPLMGGARVTPETHRDSTAALTLHWEVSEGVSPVIEPKPERPFELGPGVIGIDR